MDQPRQEKNQPQIVQMMTTEHYNLQSGRSLAISDANGRAGLFLGTVSSTLVALAFIGNISHVGTQLGSAFYVFALVLLIARAVMAVLFGHAIHALREEYSESTVTVKEASELRKDIEGVASELASMHEQFACELAHRDHRFHTSLHESMSQLASNIHNELAHELTLLRESFHQEGLAQEIQRVKDIIEQLQRRQGAA